MLLAVSLLSCGDSRSGTPTTASSTLRPSDFSDLPVSMRQYDGSTFRGSDIPCADVYYADEIVLTGCPSVFEPSIEISLYAGAVLKRDVFPELPVDELRLDLILLPDDAIEVRPVSHPDGSTPGVVTSGRFLLMIDDHSSPATRFVFEWNESSIDCEVGAVQIFCENLRS